MAPTHILMGNPCPTSLLQMLTVAHMTLHAEKHHYSLSLGPGFLAKN